MGASTLHHTFRMLRTVVAVGAVAYASAFAGMPLKLPHGAQASSRVALRAASPSMKIGVFYGTSTGNTEGVATRIAEKISADKVEDIGSIEPAELATYDTLIVGAPTWHTGEDKERSGTDWDSVIYSDLPGLDLSAKKVAFFGCGDSASYGDYFCDAVGELYDQFSKAGVDVIGKTPVQDGIECIESKAIEGDNYVGLCCDEDNYYDKTDAMIDKWVGQLKSEGAK